MTALPIATGKQSLAALATALRAHRAAFLLALTWTMLSAAATVTVPLLLGRLVDAVRVGGPYPTGPIVGTGVTVLTGAFCTALAL
jgi:ATP-binding cassette, subfamily C, bacterial